jgi:tRNA modification GTPase
MDTIAAIATGGQLAAIGVIRLSGPEAVAITEKVFRPARGQALSDHPARQMVYGTLFDREGRAVDQCLAVAFSAGHSYTGEESVELHCHGSPVVLTAGLEALFAHGARQAQGGEFTKRAFLNGQMDLTQAEAVIDLIESETVTAARNAVEQLGGSLRGPLEAVYDRLLDVASRFYAVVDYPDEDIEDLGADDLRRTIEDAEGRLRSLLATYRRGQVLRGGVPTAILGRPNVGKSSLLNALVGYDRAIVTDVAGTTRDTVEDKAVVGGVLLRLVDTAGIRSTSDPVERLGVERSQKAAETAQLALLVLDGSEELTDADEAAIAASERAAERIVLVNKADLPQAIKRTGLEARFGEVLYVSAQSGEGLEALEAAVAKRFPAGEPGQVLTNARQAQALQRAVEALQRAREALGLTPDAVLTDVEEAQRAIGELTGRTVREDLVERIFSRFCVGK